MDSYLIVKSLHIIAVISWMAGMLYLPRLYVYHASATPGGEASEMLKTMERKLLRYIMNPAMIATFVFGIILIFQIDALSPGNGWFHAKLLLVLVMAGVHGMLAAQRRAFAEDRNTKSARYFRMLNEAPTLLLIIIVFLVVVKPF